MADQNEEIKHLAALIHGASNHKSSYDQRVAFGSTALNRITSGRSEFGIDGVAPQTVSDAIYSNKSPYYESNGKNERFNNYMAGNIASFNEKEAKRNLQIASGLIKGTIKPSAGQFFIRDSEKKASKMDFTKLDKVNTLGGFGIYSYKEKKQKAKATKGEGSFDSAFGKARKAGLDTFTWKGKKYTTELK
ncbi:MAG: hypothetical protein GY861_15675 [bacterium]|nr:hypothetical protein [bacterium]